MAEFHDVISQHLAWLMEQVIEIHDGEIDFRADLEKRFSELELRLRSVEERPVKTAKKLWWLVIGALVTAAIGWMVSIFSRGGKP